MGTIASAALAGSAVRRMREDLEMPRAELAELTGIGARTLYALESGESENFGLGNFLKVLDALGLTMSIDVDKTSPLYSRYVAAAYKPFGYVSPLDDFGDAWQLDD